MFGNIFFTLNCSSIRYFHMYFGVLVVKMIACILIQCRYDGYYRTGFILQIFAYFSYLCRVKNKIIK